MLTKILSFLRVWFSLCLVSGVAGAQPVAGFFAQGSTGFGPGSPGFLSTCSSTFAVTNVLLQSQNFSTSPWANSSAPTLTANAAVAPDSTTTATQMTMPAVSGGGRVFIYQDLNSFSGQNFYYTFDIYVKGTVGGESFYITNGAGGAHVTTSHIVASTSWQRFSMTYQAFSGTGFIEIGTDQYPGTGEANTPAQSFYIWGASVIPGTVERNYIPTTTGAVTQNQVVGCPASTAFRNFSTLTAYSGNPITAQNTGTYNAGGVSAPYTRPWAKSGATYYAIANCTITGGTRNNWPNMCLYSGPDPLHWTDASTVNPVLTATPGNWDDHYLLHGAHSPACSVATYCYYYSALSASGVTAIGLATSSDLIHWSKYGTTPIVSNANGGPGGYGLPSIIQIGATLYMYTCAGGAAAGAAYMVYFTSPASDGINWTFGGITIFPEPTTAWDSGFNIFDPFVFLNSHGFYEMAYSTASAGAIRQRIGYAISKDGINWYPQQGAPIITQGGAAYTGGDDIGDTVFIQDGTTFTWIGNYDDGGTISAGVAATMTDH